MGFAERIGAAPLQLTDWVHVTRPAAATGAGTRTCSLGKAPDTPPPSCRSAPGAS